MMYDLTMAYAEGTRMIQFVGPSSEQVHPTRSSSMAQVPSDDPLYSAPPPVTRPDKKAGSNNIPLGTRKNAQQHMVMSTQASNIGHQPEHSKDWNFGSGELLPSSHSSSRPSSRHGFQQLAMSDDPDLLEHLTKRRVSPGFLFEIDQFLGAHPELLEYAPAFVEEFNSAPPLRAYKHFLKGYTKPARYIRGVIPDGEVTFTADFRPPELTKAYDEELAEFFDGYEYRYDILERIDRDVHDACEELRAGMLIPHQRRRLVSYAVFGNPVDAFKYYEYNYQTEWLAHRYLPEHVVLSEIPKPKDYTEPEPIVLGSGNDRKSEGQRDHNFTRLRMARAKNQGADVIEVLLDDFVNHLDRKGLKRVVIEDMRVKAQRAIDAERDRPSGADIVNLVMGMAYLTPNAPSHSRSYRTVFANYFPTTFNSRPVVVNHTTEKRLSAKASSLRGSWKLLQLLYRQETESSEPGFPEGLREQIAGARRQAERQYVGQVVPYLQEGKRITDAAANDLRLMYSKKRKTSDEKQRGNADLLALFPPELK